MHAAHIAADVLAQLEDRIALVVAVGQALGEHVFREDGIDRLAINALAVDAHRQRARCLGRQAQRLHDRDEVMLAAQLALLVELQVIGEAIAHRQGHRVLLRHLFDLQSLHGRRTGVAAHVFIDPRFFQLGGRRIGERRAHILGVIAVIDRAHFEHRVFSKLSHADGVAGLHAQIANAARQRGQGGLACLCDQALAQAGGTAPGQSARLISAGAVEPIEAVVQMHARDRMVERERAGDLGAGLARVIGRDQHRLRFHAQLGQQRDQQHGLVFAIAKALLEHGFGRGRLMRAFADLGAEIADFLLHEIERALHAFFVGLGRLRDLARLRAHGGRGRARHGKQTIGPVGHIGPIGKLGHLHHIAQVGAGRRKLIDLALRRCAALDQHLAQARLGAFRDLEPRRARRHLDGALRGRHQPVLEQGRRPERRHRPVVVEQPALEHRVLADE